MDLKFAYLLGMMHDAHLINRKSIGAYGFEIEQKNKDFAKYLAKLVQELFGVKVKVEVRKRSWGTYYRIRLHSKKVYDEIIKYDFNDLLSNVSRQKKIAMIRGLFDAEGSITSNEVRIFSKDILLLEVTKQVIESFDIHCGNIVRSKEDVMQLPIYAKYYKNKFMRIFKPAHPEKYTFF